MGSRTGSGITGEVSGSGGPVMLWWHDGSSSVVRYGASKHWTDMQRGKNQRIESNAKHCGRLKFSANSPSSTEHQSER